MRGLVWALAAAMAIAAVPQAGQAQNRDREDRIRDVRRTQQEARQRQQVLERRNTALARARRDTYERDRRRDGDRSIADILRERLDRRDRERRDRDVWRRSDDRRVDTRSGNGPPFCRNGQGHPVHGWQWCRDKGWSRDHDRYDRYDRHEDVLRRAPYPDRERDRRVDAVGRARGVGAVR